MSHQGDPAAVPSLQVGHPALKRAPDLHMELASKAVIKFGNKVDGY